MLRLTYRPQSDWRTVLEISAMLRKIDPADPIRYDFALAHLGISGRCHHQFKPALCTPVHYILSVFMVAVPPKPEITELSSEL